MSLLDLFRQLSLLIIFPAVLLAGLGAALIVISRDWRLVLVGYVLVFTMLTVLLVKILPAEWALLQALAGALISVMLYLSARQLRGPRHLTGSAERETLWPQMASLTSFRVMAVTLAAVTFLVLRDRVGLPRVDDLFRDAILWLVMLGILGLALHEEPLHAGLALLTVLGGLGLLIFSLIQSRMVIGLVLGGQLVLGLAVAYLMLSGGLSGLARDAADGT